MWNNEYGLCDVSYSLSDIQDYFKCVIQKNVTESNNPRIRIYKNKIEHRITFTIKTGYYLEVSRLKNMKLLGSAKSNITKDGNVENVPHLEIGEVVLIDCNTVNNNYQQNSRVLYKFILNKSFGQLLNIFPKNFYIFKNL